MALQHSIVLDSGITLPEAYVRIFSIVHTHTETVVKTETWASAQARIDQKPVVRQEIYELPWTADVSLTSVYTALKQLPDFSAAVDV